jgi:hypothetical protein
MSRIWICLIGVMVCLDMTTLSSFAKTSNSGEPSSSDEISPTWASSDTAASHALELSGKARQIASGDATPGDAPKPLGNSRSDGASTRSTTGQLDAIARQPMSDGTAGLSVAATSTLASNIQARRAASFWGKP